MRVETFTTPIFIQVLCDESRGGVYQKSFLLLIVGVQKGTKIAHPPWVRGEANCSLLLCLCDIRIAPSFSQYTSAAITGRLVFY